MTKKEVINYVKTLIKSKTVVKEIERRNNEMEEMDILYFIEQYSKDYNIKINCYKTLKNIFKDEHALELLEYLHNFEILKFSDFKKNSKNVVFEIINDYEDEKCAYSMLFTKYKSMLEYLKKIEDPLDPTKTLIRKRYIDINIKECECISSNMDVIGEMVVYKDEVLSLLNNNVGIDYPWYEYNDGNKSRIRKQTGIICGEYKPAICSIFKAKDVVEIFYNRRKDIGVLTNYNSGYNPCSIHIDEYKDIICRYEDLTKIEEDEDIE